MSDKGWTELEDSFFTDGDTLSESRTAPEDFSWLGSDAPSESRRARVVAVARRAVTSPRPRQVLQAVTTRVSKVPARVRATTIAVRARVEDAMARTATAVDAATRRFEEAELFAFIAPKRRVTVVGVVVALFVSLTAAIASAR